MRYRLLLGLCLLVLNGRAAQGGPIDPTLAHQYFQEAEVICNQDHGKLWGVSLCGPILLVDQQTRAVVANQSDREGNLTREGDVFVGKLPERMNVANTATDWAGLKWTMMIWPLPEDSSERAKLIAHELWHRVQDDLGFPSTGPSNNHLDSLEGRTWLRLEWRALERALTQRGTERRRAIEDALLFRSYRRSLFPQAAAEERDLEMHEGLAEYTGVKLAGLPHVAEYVANQLKEAERKESFVRSFAYASGPAYGVLLDEAAPGWRQGLKPSSDLGVLLQQSLSIKLPRDVQPEAIREAKLYDGEALRAAEVERDKRRRQIIAAYRARLVDGPLMVIPLQKMSMQFDPNTLQPLDALGTVYPKIRIVDAWGILTVTGGALMNPTFSTITVPAPSDFYGGPVRGDGWTLELNSGWAIMATDHKGNYVVRQYPTRRK